MAAGLAPVPLALNQWVPKLMVVLLAATFGVTRTPQMA
jgi:hypothetical protein